MTILFSNNISRLSAEECGLLSSLRLAISPLLVQTVSSKHLTLLLDKGWSPYWCFVSFNLFFFFFFIYLACVSFFSKRIMMFE